MAALTLVPHTGVHIWRIDTGDGLTDTSAALALLGPQERDRARRLWQGPLRNQYVATQAALRQILARYVSTNPEAIRFGRLATGKPFVDGSPVGFNVAHTDSFSLCAIAASGSVGVDVERRRQIADADAMARKFFTAIELAEYERRQGPPRLEFFYRLWTRKEALLKATGDGLRRSLASIDVGTSDRSVERIHLSGTSGAEGSWSLRSFSLSAAYSGAVAFDGRVAPLSFFEWREPVGHGRYVTPLPIGA